MIQSKNIAICIILSLVTCGLYDLYWFVTMTNDTNLLACPEKQTSGGMALFLTLITCGLYSLYWAYRMGENLDIAASRKNQPVQNRAVMYLILELVLPIVGWVLMQNTINQLIEK